MRGVRAAGNFVGMVGRRGVSSALVAPKTNLTLNCVVRDHDQGTSQNAANPHMDSEYVEVLKIWNELNLDEAGYPIAGSVETGGQELGSCAMNAGVSVAEYLQQLHALTPNKEKRSLSRGVYGNSVFPLSPVDLKDWYNHVAVNGGNVVFKLFDYNTNLAELRIAADILKELGQKIEIAIPHSPEESYQQFFVNKIKEAAEFAKEYGATLSIKRMVAGLTEDEAARMGDVVFPLAAEHGIKKVTLHAHGGASQSLAVFLAKGFEHKFPNVSGDVVHQGSGGKDGIATFPSIREVIEALDKLGHRIELSDKQWKAIERIDVLMQQRDEAYKGVRTSGAWSTKDKVHMGMPDGGEAYTVAALRQSGLDKALGVDEAKLKEIFVPFYRTFRDDFGGVTSVTPGHKRIETGAILAMQNSVNGLKEFAAKRSVAVSKLDRKAVEEYNSSVSINDLYKGLQPAIVDAFRNDKLPQALSQGVRKFLCETHMRNVLAKGSFGALDKETKELIIAVSTDKEAVRKIVTPLVEAKKLPESVLVEDGKGFEPASLIQASGKREYSEADGVKSRRADYEKAILKLQDNGVKVDNVESSVMQTVLTGDVGYERSRLVLGKMPSARGKTAEQHTLEKMQYYTSVEPRLQVIRERETQRRLCDEAAKGGLAASSLSDPEYVDVFYNGSNSSWASKVEASKTSKERT